MVAALQKANARLRAENAELKAQIAEQAEKIARLERLISRNSGNSSMPPSTDDLPGKKPPQRGTGQGGMKRKPGKHFFARMTAGKISNPPTTIFILISIA